MAIALICGSLGRVDPNHLSALVFQQEEECQRIPQPAEGKRLRKLILCLPLPLSSCLCSLHIVLHI